MIGSFNSQPSNSQFPATLQSVREPVSGNAENVSNTNRGNLNWGNTQFANVPWGNTQFANIPWGNGLNGLNGSNRNE